MSRPTLTLFIRLRTSVHVFLIWLQKPVEKRFRTFKQHQTIEDTKTKKILPEKSAPKETGKSLSKDLLRKVKRINNLLSVSNCASRTKFSLNLGLNVLSCWLYGGYLNFEPGSEPGFELAWVLNTTCRVTWFLVCV